MTEILDHRSDSSGGDPVQGHGPSVVCTIAGSSDCGGGVRHGMAVLAEDSTFNGLAEVAVRDVNGGPCNKDFGFKHPILPCLVAHAAGQTTQGDIGPDGQTLTRDAREVRSESCSLCSASISGNLPINKRQSRLTARTSGRWRTHVSQWRARSDAAKLE